MATTEVEITEASWTEISDSAAFSAQNKTNRDVLIVSAGSTPSSSSRVGFLVQPMQTFETSLTDRTWYAVIDGNSNGTDTGNLVVEEV